MSHRLIALAVLGSSIALVGCGDERSDGLTKYPVRGAVTLNGQPQQGIVVRFNNQDSTQTAENAAFPVGVTDETGAFELSTNGKKDGAVAGNYLVTFAWYENNQPPPKDRLHGKFSDPKTSEYRVTVEEAENELKPFELTFDPALTPEDERFPE